MALNIRSARAVDMDELLRLRQERNQVYLKNASLTFETAREWRSAVLYWLDRADTSIVVAESGPHLSGYMIGWVRENLPRLQPQYYGLISEMTVDGHNKQGGVGAALLEDMKQWFKARGISYIEVCVPRLQPIEQAFWRAVGAHEQVDHLWYELD